MSSHHLGFEFCAPHPTLNSWSKSWIWVRCIEMTTVPLKPGGACYRRVLEGNRKPGWSHLDFDTGPLIQVCEALQSFWVDLFGLQNLSVLWCFWLLGTVKYSCVHGSRVLSGTVMCRVVLDSWEVAGCTLFWLCLCGWEFSRFSPLTVAVWLQVGIFPVLGASI